MRIPTFLLLVMLLTGASGTAWAKDYSVPRVAIDAVIRPDGTVYYEEQRTYRFEGEFSEADYRLSRAGFDTIRDIRVLDGGTPYQLDASGRAGTYRVEESRQSVDIAWNYRARDEERTFIISFVLEGAVVRGPDHAEFFWTYLSDRWEKGTGALEVNLRFQERGNPSELLHFVRGSTGDVAVEIASDGYRLAGAGFSRRNSLAMRAVFPAELVPELPVTHPDYTLDRVLREEERHAAEAEAREARNRRRAALWTDIALWLALLSGVLFVLVYRRFARNTPRPGADLPEEPHEPPSEHPPAVAAEILQPGQLGGRHLVATLFDLCQRRYFRIVQREPEKKFFSSGTPEYEVRAGDVNAAIEALRPCEVEMAALIARRMNEGEPTIKKIFDLTKGPQRKWFSSWKRLVREEVARLALHHPDNKKAVTTNVLLQLPLLVLSIVAIALAGPIGFLPGAINFAALTLSGLLRHRTDEGEDLYRRWRAYRAALRKGDASALAGSLDRHFPYAVAFGLTNRRTEELVRQAPSHQFLWLTTVNGTPISPALLTKSVTTMTSSVTSSVASGTGASPGVAGGGAGGGAR